MRGRGVILRNQPRFVQKGLPFAQKGVPFVQNQLCVIPFNISHLSLLTSPFIGCLTQKQPAPTDPK